MIAIVAATLTLSAQQASAATSSTLEGDGSSADSSHFSPAPGTQYYNMLTAGSVMFTPPLPWSADRMERLVKTPGALTIDFENSSEEQLAKKLDALKGKVAEAESAVRESQAASARAESEAQAAESIAEEAASEADASTRKADEAQGELDLFASRMYREGGYSNFVQVAFSTTSSDPTAVLTTVGYLNSISGSFDQLKAEADSAKVRANTQKTAADQSAKTASDALLKAQQLKNYAATRLDGLQSLIQDVENQMDILQLSSAQGPQGIIGPDGCPQSSPDNTLRGGSELIGVAQLCADSVAQAATPQAALAIKYAFTQMGAPYACKGIGRMLPYRYDCSSYVSRSYALGAGVPVAGDTWAPSTRNMVPWDGVPLDRHYAYVAPEMAAPGDLILYDTGGAIYRHVVMLLADGYMLHTNACGDVAHVDPFWGYPTENTGHMFLVARRVLTDPTYVPVPFDPAVVGTPARPHTPVTTKPGEFTNSPPKEDQNAGDEAGPGPALTPDGTVTPAPESPAADPVLPAPDASQPSAPALELAPSVMPAPPVESPSPPA